MFSLLDGNKTYITLAVLILKTVLEKFDIKIENDALNTTITVLLSVLAIVFRKIGKKDDNK